MDPITVTLALATAAASGAGAGFINRAGEAAFDKLAGLSNKVVQLFRRQAVANPEFEHSLKQFEASPGDKSAAESLERVVRERYLHDDAFAAELSNLARAAERDGGDLIMQIVHVQSGARATVIGKSVGRK